MKPYTFERASEIKVRHPKFKMETNLIPKRIAMFLQGGGRFEQ